MAANHSLPGFKSGPTNESSARIDVFNFRSGTLPREQKSDSVPYRQFGCKTRLSEDEYSSSLGIELHWGNS